MKTLTLLAAVTLTAFIFFACDDATKKAANKVGKATAELVTTATAEAKAAATEAIATAEVKAKAKAAEAAEAVAEKLKK